MQFRSLFHKALAVAALGLAAAGGAQAKDVYWSVGIDAAPGVSVGVGNSRPVIVQPAPVYVAPPPVVYAPPPQVVYAPPPQVVYPGYYAARPVVVQGPVYRAYGGHHHGHHWRAHGGHGHGGKHWKKDRHWD
jgi:hypothetical protein